KLFTDSKQGIAAKLDATCTQLAGATNSVLSSRIDSLTAIVDSNNKRLDLMSSQLDNQRNALLAEFYNPETTIAAIKDNASVLSSFTAVPPLNSTTTSSPV